MGFVVNYPPATNVTVNDDGTQVVVVPGDAAAVQADNAKDAALAAQAAAQASASSAASSASAASASQSSASGSATSASNSAAAAAVSQSAAAASASSAATSAASIDSYASLPVEFRQFAASGSLLSNLPTRVHPAEQLLKQAVWWIDSAHSSASGQSVSNLGWGASALDARLGSASGADSNDPKFLDWDGENYVYLPGVAGNYLSVPDEAALDITGDIEVVMKIKPGADWTTSRWASVYKREAWWFQQTFNTINGQLRMAWRSGGLNKAVHSTVAVSANLGAAASVGWVKGTLDVDDGLGNHVVKFWTSPDGVTWTQLGATVTTAGTTSIDTSTYEVKFGDLSPLSSAYYTGDLYRAIVKDGIDGTPVLDVDCSQITSGSNTSFTALTGQTVTINRSTSGRKAVAVTHPCWLFGTDDYMEVADNALLDFGASDSFTVLAFHRPWGTQGTNDTLIAKKDNTTNTTQGWSLSGGSSTALQGQAQIGDGSAGITAVSGSRTAGAATLSAAVRDVGADDLTVYLGTAAGSAVTDTTTGSLSNSEVVRVGRLAGAGTEYFDGELVAAAIFRRALTSGEITTLSNYFAGRVA